MINALQRHHIKPLTATDVSLGVGFAMADVLIRPNIGSAVGFLTAVLSGDELGTSRQQKQSLVYCNIGHTCVETGNIDISSW